MKFSDFTLGVMIGIFGLVVMLHVSTFPEMAGMQFGPAFFPGLIGGAFLICGMVLVIGSVVRGSALKETFVERPVWFTDRLAVMRAIGVVAAVVAYALLSPAFGFLLTTALITAGLLLLMGVRWMVVVPLTLLLPLFLHYGFAMGLRVPLPRGPVELLLF